MNLVILDEARLEAGQHMPATLQDKVNYTTQEEKAVTLLQRLCSYVKSSGFALWYSASR